MYISRESAGKQYRWYSLSPSVFLSPFSVFLLFSSSALVPRTETPQFSRSFFPSFSFFSSRRSCYPSVFFYFTYSTPFLSPRFSISLLTIQYITLRCSLQRDVTLRSSLAAKHSSFLSRRRHCPSVPLPQNVALRLSPSQRGCNRVSLSCPRYTEATVLFALAAVAPSATRTSVRAVSLAPMRHPRRSFLTVQPATPFRLPPHSDRPSFSFPRRIKRIKQPSPASLFLFSRSNPLVAVTLVISTHAARTAIRYYCLRSSFRDLLSYSRIHGVSPFNVRPRVLSLAHPLPLSLSSSSIALLFSSPSVPRDGRNRGWKSTITDASTSTTAGAGLPHA